MRVRQLMLLGLSLLLCGLGQARAEYTITFSQDGNNVDASGTGSLNINALSKETTFHFGGGFLDPAFAEAIFGTPPQQ
jgi:hypothetical protein